MLDSANCPICGQNNWHNAWLCKTCGYPNQAKWLQHIKDGYIKDNTKAKKLRKRLGIEV